MKFYSYLQFLFLLCIINSTSLKFLFAFSLIFTKELNSSTCSFKTYISLTYFFWLTYLFSFSHFVLLFSLGGSFFLEILVNLFFFLLFILFLYFLIYSSVYYYGYMWEYFYIGSSCSYSSLILSNSILRLYLYELW